MKVLSFRNRAIFLSLIPILFFQHLNAEEKRCEALIRENQCIDAIAVCSLAAEQDNPKAQIALSKLYSGTLYGDFRRNYKKSFQWMEAAANQGNTDAEVEMAEMYIRGEVIPMNA